MRHRTGKQHRLWQAFNVWNHGRTGGREARARFEEGFGKSAERTREVKTNSEKENDNDPAKDHRDEAFTSAKRVRRSVGGGGSRMIE